jgi:hypothetical protein
MTEPGANKIIGKWRACQQLDRFRGEGQTGGRL